MSTVVSNSSYSDMYSESVLRSRTDIVIPAYNEEKRIGPVIDEISSFIKEKSLPWSIIVSVDGNDGTEEILKKKSYDYPFISYNKSTKRSGMGGAIKRGILASSGEYILLMDADGASNLEYVVKKMGLILDYDIVNFDRYSNEENMIPLTRRIASRGLNLILRSVFRISVKDTQCDYKLMKSSSVKSLVKQLTFSNAFFLSALIVSAKWAKLDVVELPISYNHSEGSKFHPIAEVVGHGASILAFLIRHSRFYRYVPKGIVTLYYRKFRWI